MASNSDVNSPIYARIHNWCEVSWLSWLPASLKMIRSKVKVLSAEQHFLHYRSMGIIFVAQGRVFPMWIVQPAPKSTSTLILWLSSLSASTMKSQSKMKSLSSGHGRICCFCFCTKGQVTPKRTSRSGLNSNFAKILCCLGTSKFEENPIKNWRHYRSDKVKYELFRHSRASNSEVNSPI